MLTTDPAHLVADIIASKDHAGGWRTLTIQREVLVFPCGCEAFGLTDPDANAWTMHGLFCSRAAAQIATGTVRE